MNTPSNYMTSGEPSRMAIPRDEPAILKEQTPWPFGYFDFGKAQFPNMNYFNSGFCVRPDGDWLIARRSIRQSPGRFPLNDVMAFAVRGKQLLHAQKIKIPCTAPGEQFEDPRVILHDDKAWVSCCNFVHHGHTWTGAHQILVECDKDWNATKRHDIPYGGNGRSLGDNTRNEKNWIWWFHDGRPHLVYFADPHTVAEFSPEFKLESEYKTYADLRWRWGEIRGGTPPVKAGAFYWTFFHSSVSWPQGSPRRRYVMGAYAFQAKKPFKIVSITQRPLLTGTIRERWQPNNPPCVFPCGAVLRDDKWLITMGVNDLHTGWIEIPHGELLPHMRDT